MGSTGDICKLVVGYGESEPTWYNRFYYQILSASVPTVNSGASLYAAFLEEVIDSILAVMSIYVSVVEVEAQNLTAPAEYFKQTFASTTYPGVVNSDALPPYYTVTLKCQRPHPPLRNGYKRFGGIGETVMSYETIAAPFIPTVTALANKLGEDIEDSPSSPYIFRPVIVPGEYESGVSYSPWRANSWTFTRNGTQRTRM